MPYSAATVTCLNALTYDDFSNNHKSEHTHTHKLQVWTDSDTKSFLTCQETDCSLNKKQRVPDGSLTNALDGFEVGISIYENLNVPYLTGTVTCLNALKYDGYFCSAIPLTQHYQQLCYLLQSTIAHTANPPERRESNYQPKLSTHIPRLLPLVAETRVGGVNPRISVYDECSVFIFCIIMTNFFDSANVK